MKEMEYCKKFESTFNGLLNGISIERFENFQFLEPEKINTFISKNIDGPQWHHQGACLGIHLMTFSCAGDFDISNDMFRLLPNPQATS